MTTSLSATNIALRMHALNEDGISVQGLYDIDKARLLLYTALHFRAIVSLQATKRANYLGRGGCMHGWILRA